MTELESVAEPQKLRRIAIDPISRVEGHGKITLLLDDKGHVQQARLHIVEFRGFEKFVQGRPYWEAPVMVQRLCGICPVSHQLAAAKALDHVVAYSIFNDASIRDYQFKSPQWTVGKNFDDTGAFGPVLVTADELPLGAKGLMLRTRLNGVVVQEASTDDMVFDIATLIATISEAITLKAGDIIVTGTPAGVGLGRKPPLFMKAGDVVEVEIEKIGVLKNPIVDAKA